MKRTTSKTSSKVSNKKTRYIFDTKSKIFFEDYSNPKTNIKFIFDKDEPFYNHTFEKEKINGTSNN